MISIEHSIEHVFDIILTTVMAAGIILLFHMQDIKK